MSATALDVALGLARPLSETPSVNEKALQSGLSVARKLWATNTWKNARALWNRFQTHMQELSDEPVPYSKEEAAIAFCERQQIRAASKKTYATTLQSVFRKLGEPSHLLGAYCIGLCADGATRPVRQAPPLTRQQVSFLLFRTPNLELKATIFLLWKATARMSDVQGLTRESFIVLNEGKRIIVTWGSTKTTRINPHQSEFGTTTLDADRPMGILLDRLAELSPGQRFTTVTVEQMNAHLSRLLPDPHFTSHSFKHGSVRALMTHVESGELTLTQVQHAARHRRLSSTLTYEADPLIRGPALGTQTATRLL